MASPVADGRMINRAIADSDKFAALTPEAAVLFALLIPWFNSHGKLNGGPGHIKDEICPKIPYLTYENIPALLTEISGKTNVKWFMSGGRHWIHALKFNSEHQRLEKKLGIDKLPSYSPAPVADKPQTSSEIVADKSALKDKDKDKDKKKAKEVPDTGGQQQPVDNSQPQALLEKQKKPAQPGQNNEFLLKLQSAMEKTTQKFNTSLRQQEIVNFVKSNIRSRHPEAILHCINSLIVNPGEIKSITHYLNAALKIEDGKYNARDSERTCNELKLTTPGMMSLGDILGEIRAHATP
ncbi:MAG: hypothetical protein WAN57_12525 [Smithella sp.]